MISVSKIKVRIIHQIVMPIVCIIGATKISNLIFYIFQIGPDGASGLAISILLTIILYVILIVLTGSIGNDEKEFLFAALLSEKIYNNIFKKA
jgi:hypothetical protein